MTMSSNRCTSPKQTHTSMTAMLSRRQMRLLQRDGILDATATSLQTHLEFLEGDGLLPLTLPASFLRGSWNQTNGLYHNTNGSMLSNLSELIDQALEISSEFNDIILGLDDEKPDGSNHTTTMTNEDSENEKKNKNLDSS